MTRWLLHPEWVNGIDPREIRNRHDPLVVTEGDLYDNEEDLFRFACDDCGALEVTAYRDEWDNRLCWLCYREGLDSINT